MEENKLSHKANNLTSMNIENTIMESSNSDIINQNHSMVTPPKKSDSQRWVANEKKSLENNSYKNNRWTSQSPDVIEEEKGFDSASNRRSSINKQGDKVFPIGAENKQHLINAHIYCENYLTVSKWDLNKNGFGDFQISIAMALRST